jgi:two-component system OmpR family sensor kinase
MRVYGALIASQAIMSHMLDTKFEYTTKDIYKVGMYSHKYKLLYGQDSKDINFKKPFYIKNNTLYLIDISTHLHLNIKYVVIQNNTIFKEIHTLKTKLIIYFILIFLFISIIGYFLSQLFLRPIANERNKLDKFIKDTTHELNTPITALLMSIGLLKCKDNSKNLDRIKVSINRISQIYSDLCYLLNNDLDIKNNIKNINIKDIINEQILLNDGFIKSKNIDIQINIQDYLFKIDKESISRLISNLLSNALKYSKPNSIVKITLKNNILSVKDYGIGIKQDKLELIKNRYSQINNNKNGFGIGLDIVNQVVKSYGYNLRIDSSLNEGTEVRVTWEK